MKIKLLLKLNNGIAMLCLLVMTALPASTVYRAEAAGPEYNVLGYAWSYHPSEQAGDYFQNNGISSSSGLNPLGTQGFGWISMSGSNPGSGGGTYKVTLDPITGKFSGYAWSENGGWVNFAPSGSFPSAAGTTAQSAYVDPTCLADKTRTCLVKGWIRFMEGTTGNSSWDGWVNMEIFNDSTAAAAYSFALSAPAKGVQLLPEANGFRNMSGYAWGDDLAGIIGFSKAKVELIDVCPDTKFVQTSNPKNTGVDPVTAGTQTTLPTTPKGYEVRDGMCGIFGCTDKKAVNYNENATVDDGSCIDPDVDLCTNIPDIQITVPAGYTKNPATPGIPGECTENLLCTPKSDDYNPFTKTCQTCNPNSKDYDPKTGLCEVCTPKSTTYNPVFKDCRECNPSVAAYNSTTGLCTTDPIDPGGNGDPVDQCVNLKDIQSTVPSPYTQIIQSGVKNCYVIGCTDPYAKNYNASATMSANPNICTYDPGVETCKVRGDCPSYPTAPKKPVYIET